MSAKEGFCWWGIADGVYIPAFLLRYRGVSPSAKLCFARLAKYCGGDSDKCFPSQETLADELGVSLRSVGGYLSELEADGFIEIIRQGLGEPNVYRTLRHPILKATFCGTASDPDRQDVADQDKQDSSDPSIELKEVIEEGSQSEEPVIGSAPQELDHLDAQRIIRSCGGNVKPSHRTKLTAAAPFRVSESTFTASVQRCKEWDEGNKSKSGWVEIFCNNPHKWLPKEDYRPSRKPAPPIATQTTEIIPTQSPLSDTKFQVFIRIAADHGNRTVTKQEAEAAWDNRGTPILEQFCWVRITDHQRDRAILHYRQYCEQRKTEPKFIKSPLNFLKTEPWDAYIVEPPTKPLVSDSTHRAAEIIRRGYAAARRHA